MKPILRSAALWRANIACHQQNIEHHYLNGGAWPFIVDVSALALALALAQQGMHSAARNALLRLAHANRPHAWQFNEWFLGANGQPRGMPGQSWNGSMFLLADHVLTTRTLCAQCFRIFASTTHHYKTSCKGSRSYVLHCGYAVRLSLPAHR